MEAEGIAGYLFNNRKHFYEAKLEVIANSKWENHEQKDSILKKLLGADGSRIKKKIEESLNSIKEKDEKSYNQYLKEYNDEIIPEFEEKKDKSILSKFLKELETAKATTEDQEKSDDQTMMAYAP
jgi:D-mannonate dehydratase